MKTNAMFPVKASIVVMSHLSDVEIDGHVWRLEFIKFIILTLDGDLNQQIDPDAMYAEFTADKTYRNMESMNQAEINRFVTETMLMNIKNFLIDNLKLSAIKLLIDEAKKDGKKISLREGKDYVDKFAEFLKTQPVNKM